MRFGSTRRWLIGLIGLPGASLLLSLPAAAQCAMCYASAAAAGSKGIHALKVGILVLAIPTVVIFTGVFVVAFRRRNPLANWHSQAPLPLPDEEPMTQY